MANAVAKNTEQDFYTFFKDRALSIQDMMPDHMDHKRVAAVAIAACQKNPVLMQCKVSTVWACVRDASILGLEVGIMGAAYLVPFRDNKAGGMNCQLIVGYQGLIDLCRRSGHIESIEAHVIHENDDFEIVYGTESRITHKPNLSANPGKMVAVYGVAKLKGGQIQTEVMTVHDIDKIKARSKSKHGPWQTDYEEMARKTVVRRMAKYLPKSIQMQDAITREDRTENGDPAFMASTFDESTLKDADATITDEGTDELKKAANKPAKTTAKKPDPKPATKKEEPAPAKEPAGEKKEAPTGAKLKRSNEENPDSVQNAIAEAADQFASCKGLKTIADVDTTDQGQVSTIYALIT